MQILYYTPDLLSSSRVTGAAQQAGASMKTVAAVGKIASLAQELQPRLVVLDLCFGGVSVEDVATQLQTLDSPPALIAYAPHVDEQTIESAKNAGCDHVYTRGEFNANAEAIFRQYCE